ncbi:MAG: DNA-binding transcriptional regulator [Akkermansiaceae bacterium]
MKKSLSKQSPPRVALLIETSVSYGRDLLVGIAKYVRIHGPWSIEFEAGTTCETLPEWFAKWKGDGIIARAKSEAIAKAISKKGVPFVDLYGGLKGMTFPTVRSNESAVGRLAAEHLLERGFRHFAFCGYNGIDWSDRRRDGFLETVTEAGFSCCVFENPLPKSSSAMLEYEQHGPKNERYLQKWLKSLPHPAGLMACNDSRGRQVLTCCRDLGLLVPDELAVIGVDKDEVLGELSDLPLSSVILNSERIGFEAAALLERMMRGEKPPQLEIMVEPKGVNTRHSTDVLAIDDRHLASALRHIRDHACNGLDVDSLLRAIPLSRSVLERRFLQILGSSPKGEILRVRLDRVRQLLAESDLSLVEVAGKTGFTHPEYMSRLFKKKMGITPGEFRKQARPG